MDYHDYYTFQRNQDRETVLVYQQRDNENVTDTE